MAKWRVVRKVSYAYIAYVEADSEKEIRRLVSNDEVEWVGEVYDDEELEVCLFTK